MKTHMLPIQIAGLFLVILGAWSMAVPLPPPGTPKEIASFEAHLTAVNGLAFSPDEKTLASVGGDGQLKVWDAASGKNLFDIVAHPSLRVNQLRGARCVAFSPDGKTIATGGRTDEQVKLWDAATGKNTDTLKVHWASWLQFSQDGNSLLVSYSEVWDLRTKKARGVVKKSGHYCWLASFDPEGEIHVAATEGIRPSTPALWLWDEKPDTKVVKCEGHTEYAPWIAFSRDCKMFASAGYDQTLRLWDTPTGKNKAIFDKLPKWRVCDPIFSPNGKILAVIHMGEKQSTKAPGVVYLFEVPSGKIVAALKGHKGSVTSLAFSPKGRLLATGSIRGEIKIWRLPYRYKTDVRLEGITHGK